VLQWLVLHQQDGDPNRLPSRDLQKASHEGDEEGEGRARKMCAL